MVDLKNVQSHIIKSGYTLLTFGIKLIDAYLKRGSIVDARKLFDELPVRHIVAWNTMIASYINFKKSGEAIGLFERMMLEGVFPDEYTFSSIFKSFSDLGNEREGQRAHGLSVVLGLEVSNVFVGSALVNMYAKFGKMRDARLVAGQVVDKDVVLHTALIVGYSQQGQDSEALEVFGNMINEGIKANEYTFASILIACGNLEGLSNGKSIHGLIIKSGFESVVASQTSLLTMYSKCGIISDSLKIFKRIANPNQVTWTSLIVGLVQNGREEVALKKFRQMIHNSIKPNSFTLSTVLRACSSLAMLEEGKQIHAIVTKIGLDRDRYAGAALIDLYGKCGNTVMAKLVFDALGEVDVVSINSMIYSYSQNGYGRDALELFNRMKDLGLKPNDVTFISVLLACNNSGLVVEGCRIFASIENNNCELTNDHYACMVDMLGRAGRLEEAEMLIKHVKNPDVVLWRTLVSACRIHGEVDMAERIMDKIIDLVPGDEGTHVLLSNLYASTGRWNQVIEMKSMMREMKLKKNPAMSWVDVDREVHTFMAGNLSHPNSREIIEMLEKLIKKVKILGYVPDTRFVLQELDEERKERSLYYHSEKLAIAFALWRTSNKNTTIRIFKNLRVCGDCHTWIKFVSKVVGRDIIARDAKRFHHFIDGLCSCSDYW
ncbi:PPR domain-containing protein/PPR_2 domain-containing protein/DYW_deaminase domain-containing protein [Cephalotus follicularis]|uniref:PPR domain-containing protein/PPR_2 domain-containing protein/DYW_deaminase domain-containing protein n=1 Tax=Cephalotus follicularis TaxID=3775 RepID=A0A1Q3BKZ9_CEPFO|nr:PPR domain-containing protein/PPR_2 domain-containing protein/DYW_deaminase domain-containing protein [Cephalotus follicularis]